MNYDINKTLIFSLLFISFISCKTHINESIDQINVKEYSKNLRLDHFNMWVKDPLKAKNKLIDIGFKAVPDSLSVIHHGQGTSGRYFYFLNSYLEFIFINDREEFNKNSQRNKNLDFPERAAYSDHEALPFSIALNLIEYNADSIPFEVIPYRQDWMEQGKNIYAAKNSKINLKEPSLFVVYPEIQVDYFDTMEDLVNIPEEYALWRSFFKHPNGAHKVTQLIITSQDVNLNSRTMQSVNGIDNVTIKNGKTHLMEIVFDDKNQDIVHDLRPELPIIIYL